MASDRPVNNDLLYFKQQLIALLNNTSRTVKSICVIIILGYILCFKEEAILLLGVTPGYILPPSFKIWTAFTFCFLEIHFWEVLMDIMVLGVCGKLMEPLWGAVEMITFFIIVNTCVALLSSFFYLSIYFLSFNPDLLFQTRIYGLAGYVAAVTVAIKQIIPDILIVKTPMGKITNKHIPIMIIFVTTLFWLSGLLDGTYPTMVTFGIIVGWTYLRFYQRHSNGSRGDMADCFSFASFFPNILQPAVGVLANTIYNFLIRIRVCRKINKTVSTLPKTGVRSATSQHNERQRQIALKELSERLSKSETPLLEPMVTMRPQSPKKSSDVVISMPVTISSEDPAPQLSKGDVSVVMEA